MEFTKENKKHKRLSADELRRCEGFKNYSDDEAEKTINSLEKLSILFYELFMKQRLQRTKLSIINKAEDYEIEQRNAA
jgi:predicted kinase